MMTSGVQPINYVKMKVSITQHPERMKIHMKRKPPILARTQKGKEPNKKAIIWAASIATGVIIITAILLIVTG